jgi:vacuolar-type H+-ATPase subunit I/STV1
MSANLTVVADIKAEVAALSAAVRELKATQPNMAHFASEIGTHLIKFETGVTRSFTDQFAGNFFRATEAMTARVVNLEETQAKIETALSKHVKTYDEMLETHHKKVAKMLENHEKSISGLLASNDKKLTEQQAAVSQVLKILAAYDKQFVTLYNGSVSLVESNEQTVAKIDAAVEKFDQISTGHLEEVAKKAEETIRLTSATAKREMTELSDETQTQIEGTRKHYLKTLSGLDNKVLEHPILFVLGMILVVAVAFGCLGVWAGRIGEARHTQQLINNAVDSAMQKVEERMQRIDEQTKTLGLTFEEAQYWETLTANMNYDQKMAYIKAAQEEAQRHGRKLDLPKAMQQEKARK